MQRRHSSMSVASVSAVIVLGARERRAHGKDRRGLAFLSSSLRCCSAPTTRSGKMKSGLFGGSCGERGMTRSGAIPMAEGQSLMGRVR
jgi:hypothetical protein